MHHCWQLNTRPALPAGPPPPPRRPGRGGGGGCSAARGPPTRPPRAPTAARRSPPQTTWRWRCGRRAGWTRRSRSTGAGVHGWHQRREGWLSLSGPICHVPVPSLTRPTHPLALLHCVRFSLGWYLQPTHPPTPPPSLPPSLLPRTPGAHWPATSRPWAATTPTPWAP